MEDGNNINPLIAGMQVRNGNLHTQKRTGSVIGQQEFLTMLVAQLKNQDPLNPLQNEEFAVNLAQFSQLERLISIDQKLSNQQSDVSSYAAYLGKEVTLDSDIVVANEGDAGKVSVSLPASLKNVEVSLVDGLGRVVYNSSIGDLETGTHRLPLQGLPINNGQYRVQVSGELSTGERGQVKASAVALVTGFVPGPVPALLAGDREISPSEITRVNAVS